MSPHGEIAESPLRYYSEIGVGCQRARHVVTTFAFGTTALGSYRPVTTIASPETKSRTARPCGMQPHQFAVSDQPSGVPQPAPTGDQEQPGGFWRNHPIPPKPSNDRAKVATAVGCIPSGVRHEASRAKRTTRSGPTEPGQPPSTPLRNPCQRRRRRRFSSAFSVAAIVGRTQSTTGRPCSEVHGRCQFKDGDARGNADGASHDERE